MSYDLTHFFDTEVAFFSIAGADGYFKRSNPAFERMLGWPEEDLLARSFYELVHPSDIPVSLAQLAEVERTGRDVTFESRFLHRDGAYRWLAWVVQAGPDGGTWYATARDVTEQRELRVALEQVQQRLRMAMSVSEAGSWEYDVAADRLTLDPSASALFGLPLTGWAGPLSGVVDLLPLSERPEVTALWSQRGLAAVETDLQLVSGSAAGRQVALRGRVVESDRRNAPLRAMGIAWDVTSRKQVEAQLLDLVMNDQLTGLRNRRSAEQSLRTEWRRGQRSGTPLGLLMVDVDDFKAVNDTLGHQVGDRYLAAVGRALASALVREEDVVARYGGEEFVVILPGCGVDEATAVGERLRRAVAALALPSADGAGLLSVSAGAASCVPVATERPEDLLRRADDALYVAKGAGKDRVAVAA